MGGCPGVFYRRGLGGQTQPEKGQFFFRRAGVFPVSEVGALWGP